MTGAGKGAGDAGTNGKPGDPSVGEEGRYAALKRLRGAADEAADSARAAALADPSFRVRSEAVAQLAIRPVTPVLSEILVAGLGAGENAGLRNAACDLLIRYGGHISPVVARAMNADDADVRKLAIDVAGEIAHPSLVPALLAAMHDANVNVRIAAAEALGHFSAHEAETALVVGLDDGELVFELACLESLARRRSKVAAIQLERHLQDPYMRRAAIAVLGSTPGPESLGALLGTLSDERTSILAAAVKALKSWFDNTESHDAAAREGAVRRLRSAIPLDREDEYLARIETLLDDEATASATVTVLGHLGFARSAVPLALTAKRFPQLETLIDDALRVLNAQSTDLLARALRQASAEDWVWFVRALDAVGDIRGAAALIARCERGSEPDRHLIHALGRVMDSRAIPILLSCAHSLDSEVSDLAVRSLRVIAARQPRELAAALAALPDDEYRDARGVEVEGALAAFASDARILRVLDRGPDDDRARAASALGEARSRSAFARLLSVAQSAAVEVRVAALSAVASYPLESLSADEADRRRSTLLALLDDRDPRIREAAAAAFGGDVETTSVAALAKALRDADASVTIAALRSLATIAGDGQELAWHEILAWAIAEERRGPDRLSDPVAGEVWKETLAALVHPPVPEAFGILVDALGSERWDVRAAAGRALGARRDRNAFAPLRGALQRESDLVVRRALEEALVILARETRGI